jgi:hypothetical protein
MTGLFSQYLGHELFKLDPEQKTNQLVYVTDSTPEAVKKSLPDIEETLKDLKKNPAYANVRRGSGELQNLEQFQGAMAQTSTRLNNTFDLDFDPLRGYQRVPTEISDGIYQRITEQHFNTAESREIARELRFRRREFLNAWTYEDLNKERMNAYARLHAYRRMQQEGQRVDSRLEAQAIADKEILRGAREIVYDTMDRIYGKPAGFYADLKERQSALLAMQDDFAKHLDDITKGTSRIRGAPLPERMHVNTYAHPPSGRISMGIHNLHNLTSTSRSAATGQMQRAFRSTPLDKASAAAGVVGRVGVRSYPARSLYFTEEERERRKQNLPPLTGGAPAGPPDTGDEEQ